MPTLTPVEGDPFASGPKLTPVDYDPFAPKPKAPVKARGPKLTPVSGDPFAKGSSLPKSKYGSGIEYEARKADPNLVVTSRGRSAAHNAQIGGVPDSAHTTDNARDFVPRRGESLDQAAARLRKSFGPGYKVLVEGAGAKHSTGPHIHVEATGAAQVLGPKLTPVNYDPFAPRPAKAPAAKPVKAAAPKLAKPAPKPIGWGEAALQGFENIPSSAAGLVEGLVDSVRHPLQTIDSFAGSSAKQGFDPLDMVGSARREARERLDRVSSIGRNIGSQYKAEFGSAEGFKKKLATDPVGMVADAAMALGAGSGVVRSLRGAGEAGTAERAAAARKAAERPAIVRQITRPETVDIHSRKAAPVIARARSVADLAKQQGLARLQPVYRALKHLDLEGQRDFVRHIEGTPVRGTLSPELVAAAEEVKAVLAKAGADLSDATGVPLRTSYFPHDWMDPDGGTGRHGSAPPKVGTGQQTRARTIETLDDGLSYGLREQHSHPLDAVSHYLEDTYNRVSHSNALRALRAKGQARWFPERAVPKGWTALEGPDTTRDARPLTQEIAGAPGVDGLLEHKGMLGRQVLAARDSVATLHNNRLAPSLKDTKAGPLAHAGLAVANAARTSLLGAGSLAHTGLTSIKAFGSELSRGANEFLRSDPVEGAKAVADSFVAPVSLVGRGVEMEKNLLRHGPRTEVEKLYVGAGGRVRGSASYEANLAPSWYESARRRTFVQDLGKDAAAVAAAEGFLGKGKAGAAAVGRALKTVNHFTFKYQVPAVKRGVFDAEMRYFLKHNPGASEAEKLAYARRTLGSIDNRFGEMVADNNFWHTWYQEASRMALLSPSWVQGNIRLFGDALKDAPRGLVSTLKGEGMTPDVSAMFGVWASRAIVAGMLTYVLAGELPSAMDWVAPRTGGKNRDGSPERMQVLSSMKDLDQLMYGGSVPDELYGKLNPAVQTGSELLRNEDYFGRRIYRPQGVDPIPGDGGHSRPVDAALYAARRNAPIGMQAAPDNPDSRLPAWTRLVGVMPAGQKYSNPDKREANQRKYGTEEWKRAVASRRRERVR